MTKDKPPTNENVFPTDISDQLFAIEMNLHRLSSFINDTVMPRLNEVYYHVFPDRREREKRFERLLELEAAYPDAPIEGLIEVVADNAEATSDELIALAGQKYPKPSPLTPRAWYGAPLAKSGGTHERESAGKPKSDSSDPSDAG
jgi:hypothetical protein